MFENMTNQEVKAVIDGWEQIPSIDLARETLHQIFVVNKTPLSYDNKNDVCVYNKTQNGMGCAVACLIPEKLKFFLTETERIGTIIKESNEIKEYIGEFDVFVAACQRAHDDCCGFWYPAAIEKFHKFLKEEK